MRKWLLLVIGSWLVFATTQVDAGWLTAAKRDFYRSHHRSHCWPHPYNLMDQQAVRDPFRLMIERGWQAQNTIRSEHFESGTEKLNAYGRRHVRWILTRVPETQRVLFVQPAESSRQTARRLAAVEHVARLAKEDTGVEVVLATVAPPEVTPPRATQAAADGPERRWK